MDDRQVRLGAARLPPFRAAFVAAAVLFVAGIALSCANPLQATLKATVKAYSTPVAASELSSGNGISRVTPIVVSFTEIMDTSSLSLGGTMAVESDGGKWSQSKSANDTLTIAPRSTWSAGSGKSLIVNCKDLDGYSAKTVALTLGVLDGVVYVRASDGNDANPGAPDLPKLTIPVAIALAAKYYAQAEVHVAQGVYNVSFLSGTHVVMVGGISLLGGYSASSWSTRSASTYVSIIKDTSTAATTQKLRAVDCGAGLGSTTLLDGFTVTGGGGSSNTTVAVYCDASNPTISNNNLDGGSGNTSAALRITNSSPLVQGNTITGGTGVDTIGIFTSNSSAQISSNTIAWGQGSNSAYGILNVDSTPTITANTIGGSPGMPWYSWGIYNQNSSAIIERNSIDGGYAYTAVTGVDNDAGGSPRICDNIIHGGQTPSGQQSQIFAVVAENGSTPYIECNTIDIGNLGQGKDSSNYSMAIGIMVSASSPYIDNNIIFSNNAAVSYIYRFGVVENSSSTPSRFRNNDIYNCPDGLYWHYPSTIWTTVTTLNTMGWASGNVSASPVFSSIAWPNPNWHLTASSPSSVYSGGITLSDTDLQSDRDGKARSAPWSMGAYEYP